MTLNLAVALEESARANPDKTALIEKEKVTLSHCVPTVLRMILDGAVEGDVDLNVRCARLDLRRRRSHTRREAAREGGFP